MKNVELLAPAGNMDALKFAVDAGADAVYIGGEKYSARAFSSNFDLTEIKEAVKYAHLRNVQVYVAVNTLILTNEFNDCLEFIDELYYLNVDAIIVQDYGLLNVAVNRYPDMEIHASTQMTVDSYEAVSHLESLGVDRVVLSREMGIDEIKSIRAKTNIPLEIFVSGALCLSYSGQCLMSSLIGGRSGNRGTCTQNCRKKYDLLDEDGKPVETDGDFLLSSKDLLILDELDELSNLGNVSLKIEGRMKRKEYVKKIVSIFRKRLDYSIIEDKDITELKTLFNREFTKGHMFSDFSVNQHRPNHLGIEIGEVVGSFKVKLTDTLRQGDGIRVIGDDEFGLNVNMMEVNNLLVNAAYKGDVVKIMSKYKPKIGSKVVKTTDVKVIDELNKESYYQKYDIYMETSYCGTELSVNVFDDFGTYVYYSQEILEVSDKNHSDRIKKQLSKSGDYPFNIDVLGDLVEVYAKSSDLNTFRRNAINLYIEEKLSRERRINEVKYPVLDVKVTEDVIVTAIKPHQILNEYPTYSKILADTFPIQARAGNQNFESAFGIVSNLSGLETYEEFSTNFSLNVTNPYSVYYLHKVGANKVCLSVELNKKQIIDLLKEYNTLFNHQPNVEVIVYGKLESMVIKHEYNDGYSLVDTHGEQYKITRDELTTIYHSKTMSIIDRLDEIPVMNYRLDFTFESKAEVDQVINHFKEEEKMHNYYGHFDLGIKKG